MIRTSAVPVLRKAARSVSVRTEIMPCQAMLLVPATLHRSSRMSCLDRPGRLWSMLEASESCVSSHAPACWLDISHACSAEKTFGCPHLVNPHPAVGHHRGDCELPMRVLIFCVVYLRARCLLLVQAAAASVREQGTRLCRLCRRSR